MEFLQLRGLELDTPAPWNWEYRFEAYTPVAKRKLGYYALLLLWRERVIGWANVTATTDCDLVVAPVFVAARPRERAFARALEEEVERLRYFFGLARNTRPMTDAR